MEITFPPLPHDTSLHIIASLILRRINQQELHTNLVATEALANNEFDYRAWEAALESLFPNGMQLDNIGIFASTKDIVCTNCGKVVALSSPLFEMFVPWCPSCTSIHTLTYEQLTAKAPYYGGMLDYLNYTTQSEIHSLVIKKLLDKTPNT